MIQTGVSDRFVDAAQMFGDRSEVVVPALEDMAGGGHRMPGDLFFQLLCILLLFAIALLLRHRYELRVLAGSVGRSLSEDFESSRKLTPLTGGFLNSAAVAGVLTVAVVAVRYSNLWLADWPYESIWLAPVITAGVIAALSAVALYEAVMIWGIGIVAGKLDFCETLIYVKRAFFSLSAVLLSPVVLLSALSPDEGRGWLWLLAAECFVLSLLFLKETLVLFIRKKIPIFQWFLYLCTVEAFPITLICASIARLR